VKDYFQVKWCVMCYNTHGSYPLKKNTLFLYIKKYTNLGLVLDQLSVVFNL